MTVLLWLIGIYVLSYVVVMFVNLVDDYSITKTIFLILFIPFVMIWEIIGPYLEKIITKMYRKRLQREFGVKNMRQLNKNKECRFLLVDNKVKRFFNIFIYTLFGIKLKLGVKND